MICIEVEAVRAKIEVAYQELHALEGERTQIDGLIEGKRAEINMLEDAVSVGTRLLAMNTLRIATEAIGQGGDL